MKSVTGDGSPSSNVLGGDQPDANATAHQPNHHGAHITSTERRVASYEVDDLQRMDENEDTFNPVNHGVESLPNLDFWNQGPASSPGLTVSSTIPFTFITTDPSESFSASLIGSAPPPPPATAPINPTTGRVPRMMDEILGDIDDADFDEICEFCPFYLLSPFQFIQKPWNSCLKPRAEFSHTITHCVSDHAFIRGNNPHRHGQRFITRCSKQDPNVKGKSKCKHCNKPGRWIQEDPGDPVDDTHFSSALCLRCYTLFSTRAELLNHFQEREVCIYREDTAVRAKMKFLYTGFASSTTRPKFSLPISRRAEVARRRRLKRGQEGQIPSQTGRSMLPPNHLHRDLSVPSSVVPTVNSNRPIHPLVPAGEFQAHAIPPSDSGYDSIPIFGGTSKLSCASSNHGNLQMTLDNRIEELGNEAQVESAPSSIDDCGTVYTDGMTISDVRLQAYMTTLVEDLCKQIGSLLPNPEIIEALVAALPRILKAFASRLGSGYSSQMHRDVMVFIHKYRGTITEMFRGSCTDAMDGEQIPDQKRHPLPMEMMNQWLATTEQFEYESLQEQIEEMNIETGVEEDHDLSIPDLEEYKRIISSAPSYAWVVGQLRRELLLSRPIASNAMEDIRESVLKALPRTHRVSRSVESQTVEVVYRVKWDALAFFRGQEYEDPPHEVINRAITLTGSITDAQACSCQQYMDQTWPCTGLQTLRLIQKMLQSPDYEAQTFVSEPSGCKLAAALFNGMFMVRAWGIPEFVAEIGEQIAWLGAALQLSPHEEKMAGECTPFMDEDDTWTHGSELRCTIKFDFHLYHDQPRAVNGQCWHDMFHKPVIVQGFPIPRRPESDTGLEMPLSLMTLLTRTRYIDEFSSRMYIKGFSTMLIPTKQFDGTIYWHLLFNKDPEQRIPYLGCGIEHAVVQKTDLEASRHILGWCSDAVQAAGSLLANYNISRSQLPFAHSSCALDKVEIHAGQLVSGTACFSFGNREKPVHISRDGYFTKLSWISSKWVVLWDEGEKRGWLVNGASALLHILRASLAHSERKFKSAFLMSPHDLHDVEGSTGAEAALRILTCERNRSLPLYRENVEFETSSSSAKGDKRDGPETRFKYYRLENQVEHIYNMFEKLVEHQTNVEQRSGVRISSRPRRQLEGWDFKDLVTDGDPFFARVATLNAMGKGWVDFIRSIHAVTLFGRGFGELIRPKSVPNAGCSQWLKLPTERYYLAACMADLREIMEAHGDPRSSPMKLCDNILWFMKENAFQPCPCETTAKPAIPLSKRHFEPVQALFPLTFKNLLRKRPAVELQEAAAVIFGHNINIHWHWGDYGDPVKGDPAVEEKPTSDLVDDSGLGSSLSSSGSPSAFDSIPPPSSDAEPASIVPRGKRRHVQGVISSIGETFKLAR